MPVCYRCSNQLLDITAENLTDISFYVCQKCECQYAQKPAGSLHDRWRMPLTIALYDVIYDRNPLDKLDQVTRQIQKRKSEYIELLIEHIKDELVEPKQHLVDIHDFVYPNEQNLREFLGALAGRLESFD
jgi:hypothetical protein